MCGLAGVVRRDGAIAPDPSAALGAALAHRGPDGRGVWRAPAHDVLLVHTRLAIIDPGPSGAQPMASADGRHRIVFNGEVYNYRDLRRSLELRGERFTTGSDTEVLLRLLALDGAAALAQVRGMFALAWWDAESRALVLARDRFGIKPLYVAATERSIVFASEIHALVSSGLVERAIDPAGVLGFLAWGTVPPSLTYLAGVESLPAGSWLRWSQDGGCSRRAFADITATYARPHSGCTEAALRQRVGAAVHESVAAHLVADVPVGLFLSGGIDSSAILSAASGAGIAALNTYTVRFDGPSSEHDYARIVASTFGATHHELVLDASRIVGDLPGILARLDQPTLDAVNSYYVSAAVAKTGIKAVLSGAGGDELFGGYPSFTRLPSAMRWKNWMAPLAPAMTPAVSAVLPERLTERWRHFMTGNGTMDAAYRAQRGLYMPAEVERIAGPALRDRWAAATARVAAAESDLFHGGASTLEGNVARLETRVYLRSQLLRDLDVMSMSHGLEVRVPFVDHVLLDAVWPDLGAHPSLMRNKRLLHETLARPLPTEAVDRPKQGFTLPFAQWMAGDLQPFVRAGMAHLADDGWIARDAADAVWADWQRGAAHWSRPWALGVLGAFLGAGMIAAELPVTRRLRPSQGWSTRTLSELWTYRELLYFFIWRDIKVRYKQTLLGAGWAIVQPLMTMVVFTIFFGHLAKVPSDGLPYPVFSLIALVPWSYFASALAGSSTSLSGYQHIISKVYFPRLIIPLAAVIAPLVDFAIGFVILIGFMAWYRIVPGAAIVWLPALMLLAICTAASIGVWLSALNVRYRDVRYVVPFVVQLWMFATPVAYPASLVPGRWRAVYGLNPMAGVIEGFRWALAGGPAPGIITLVSAAVVVALIVGGAIYFRRLEGTFADVI